MRNSIIIPGTTNHLAAGATSGGYQVMNSLSANYAKFQVGIGSSDIISGIWSPPDEALPPVFYTSGPFTISAELWDAGGSANMDVSMNGTEQLSGTGSGGWFIGSGGSLGFDNAGDEPAFISNMEVYTTPEPNATALLLLSGILVALSHGLRQPALVK